MYSFSNVTSAFISKTALYFRNTFRPVYTWRTLTGVNLNNNRTQYSKPAIFWQRNKVNEPELHLA